MRLPVDPMLLLYKNRILILHHFIVYTKKIELPHLHILLHGGLAILQILYFLKVRDIKIYHH